MYKAIVFFLMLTTMLTAAAKPNIIGNGGHSVKNGKSFFLLDLAELNLDTKPYFGAQRLMDQRISYALMYKVSPEVISLVQRKVYDVLRIDRILAESLIISIQNLKWSIRPGSLNFISVDTTISKDKLRQVAIRNKNTVQIDQNIWLSFNAANKAALIIHEAMYTIAKKNINEADKSLSLIRNLTGYLFSEDISRIKRHDFQTKYRSVFLTESDLPINFSTYEKIDTKSKFRLMVFNPLLITDTGSILPLGKSHENDLNLELCFNNKNLTQAFVMFSFFNQRLSEQANYFDETLTTEIGYSSKIFNLHRNEFDSCNSFVDAIVDKLNEAYPGLVETTYY